MTDFPNLDMSIGEYYKLLLQGKRPTRQTRTNEEMKQLASLLEKPNSKAIDTSLKNKKEKSEKIESSHHKDKEKGAEKPEKHERQKEKEDKIGQGQQLRQMKDREAKRKVKMEDKLRKLQTSKKGPNGGNSSGHGGTHNISVMKNSLIVSTQKGRLEQIKTRDHSHHHQNSARDHHQQSDKKKKAKEESKKHEEEKGEESDNGEQEKAKDDKRITDKFEMVVPHPGYCQKRFVLIKSKDDGGDYTLHQITNVVKNEENVGMEIDAGNVIGGDEEKSTVIRYQIQIGDKDDKIDFEESAFVQKIFTARLGAIDNRDTLIQKSLLNKEQITNDTLILIAQKIDVNAFDQQNLKFVTIYHNKEKKQTYAVDIKFKDSVNPYKELKEFDQKDYSQSTINKQYNQQSFGIKESIDQAEKINTEYNNYLNSLRQVAVTRDNLEDLLYSVIVYESISEQNGEKVYGKQRFGIFLRARYDNYYQDYLVFLRQLHVKNNQKERTEWIQLNKNRVRADLTRGFVSIDQISGLENANYSQHKLTLRHLQMVSERENREQRKSLRRITHIKNDHDEPTRMALISKESNNDRCNSCNYITQNIEHLKCANCSKAYHVQCLKKKSQGYLGLREKQWYCSDCTRCTNCLSSKNRNQLLNCKQCNSCYHFDCLDQSVKLSIPALIIINEKESNSPNKKEIHDKKGLIEAEFKCDLCIECEHCGAKEAGKSRLNKWSKDCKLCSNCNKKKKFKQYCLVCERFWPDHLTEESVSEEVKKVQLNEHMIQCNNCEMWVHQDCDRIFQIPDLRSKFNDQKYIYNCVNCRQQLRTQLLQQLVEKLSNEDRCYFFQEPVEHLIQSYTKVVKTPMCFKYIKQKINSTYLRNPEQLKADCNLMFSNAKIFNLPKHKVHKEALRMEEACNQIINSVWGALEKNKLRTLDEDTHTAIVKDKVPKHIKQTEEQKEQKLLSYVLKPDDMFEQQEHLPQQKHSYSEQNLNLSDIDDDSQDVHDPAVTLGGGNNQNLQQTSGISKNLRTRKNINYNEDKLLSVAAGGGIGGATHNDLSQLSGQKRLKTTQSQIIDPDDTLNFSGKGKRQRLFQQESHQFQPMKGTNLLQQAIQQQAKLEEQQNAHNHESNNQNAESTQTNHIQQQQQMMMNYYQEIDDEKCYYSNPARCSFDDPALMFEEMCYLCGSFGNREDFLSCTLCGESFHTFCLQLPSDQVSKYQSYWKCLNCKFCEICASASSEAYLLYCDVCDKAFHSFCLTPKLNVIPNCQWKCQECFQCNKCGTKNFFTKEETDQNKNLELSDFEFSQNFAFCYSCGVNEYKKSFCKICQNQNDLSSDDESSVVKQKKPVSKKGNNDLMMKCRTCGFYSHIRCSRLLPNQEYDESNYKCLECLLVGKTINHMIRETCEHYENIHQIISRQRLLASLCSEILQGYFPLPEKAPLFIKSFIDQNYEFFRQDKTINDWLELLETNVCFELDEPTTDEKDGNDTEMRDMEDEEENEISQDVRIIEKEEIKKASQDGKVNKRGKVLQSIEVRDVQRSLNEPEINQKFEREIKYDKDLIILKDILNNKIELSKIYNGDRPIEEQIIDKVPQNFTADQINHLIVHSKTLIQKTTHSNQICSWDGLQFNDIFTPFKPLDPSERTDIQTLEKELYGHKRTFLPPKRNLYKSLHEGNLHKYAQRDHFMDPTELGKYITVPTEENLERVNYAELLVRYEFKAVMKIKMQFFSWFQDMVKNIIKNNSKYLKKEQKKKEDGNQIEDMEMINTNQVENYRSNNFMSEDDIINDEDFVIHNPQMKLQCVLCRLNGELNVTGRLIPFQVNQFAHVNCVYWSTDVHESGGGDGQLINFYYVYNGKQKYTKCWVCGETGATLFCYTKKCHQAFHFPCAYRHNKMAFLRSKETYCDVCSRQRGFKIGYLSEYTTKRRFQIVKNQIPYNLVINIPNNMATLPQVNINIANIQNATDIDKPLQIEKWRPYYYDMFNRVGNLTVLSLRREINLIIDESNQNKNINNLDQSLVQDFSTIRIYWKFYQDSQMQIESENSNNPIQMKKSYFVYNNNQIKEISKNDLKVILDFVSDKIKEKVKLGILHNQMREMIVDDNQNLINNINQANFWQKIMQHFQKERPNFSLQNIIFSISEFGGKTKYPISIWNRAEIKNKSFFLKNGRQVLESQNITAERDNQGQLLNLKKNEGMTLEDVFKRMAKINQMGENQNPMSSIKRMTCSKHIPYEEVLRNLGKKMFYKAQPNEHADDQAHKNQQKLQKKIRQTDTFETVIDNHQKLLQNKEIDLPIAMKYRLSKSQPKKVEVGPSKIHRNGLFTLEDLMQGDIVIEYMGEKIRNKVADKREIVYEQKGIGDCYLFRLDKEYIIDATFHGNKARYLNHSCDANCSARQINVQGLKHIIISANRPIKSGEELTYNYNFDYEADKLECFCGAPSCIGRLN